MRKNSTMNNRTRTSLTRGRVAVVTGGVVAAIALGSTAAFAAGGGAHEVAKATSADAKAPTAVQHKAAAKTAAAKTADVKAKVKASAVTAKKKASDWTTPVSKYTIGAGYHQVGKHWINTHSGQDFVVPTGTAVHAAHSGTVVTAGWGGAYGNNIVIKHGSHLYTQYGHLSKFEVHVGQHVTTGQEIAKSGSTGNSTGPHLHFEVRTTPYYGSSVEPLHFLRVHGVHA